MWPAGPFRQSRDHSPAATRPGSDREEEPVSLRTRIARLTAASAVVVTVGALGAGPASASYSSWAGSVPDVVWAADDEAQPDKVRTLDAPAGSIQAI